MKYSILTFGCQMNHSDSERIAAVLEKNGYSPTPNPKGADLIIFNACSVRQSAVDRIFGQINNINKLTRRPKTILTGCVLKTDKKKFADKFDLILNTKDLLALNKTQARSSMVLKRTFRAYIPISTGCNNYCSYCVVPYTRGPERSRPAEKILSEVKIALKNGFKEIWLLGQNVNSYKDKNITFPKLLRLVDKIPGEFRIQFISSHPKDISDELIETVAECEKVCPPTGDLPQGDKSIHLPIQSGDNAILKKMNRHYTVAHYKNLIKKIRKRIPDIAISTDIIVGFPGETKKRFENTVKLCKQIRFDNAYISKYSPRPSTAAAKLKDDIPSQEKKRRWKILDTLINPVRNSISKRGK